MSKYLAKIIGLNETVFCRNDILIDAKINFIAFTSFQLIFLILKALLLIYLILYVLLTAIYAIILKNYCSKSYHNIMAVEVFPKVLQVCLLFNQNHYSFAKIKFIEELSVWAEEEMELFDGWKPLPTNSGVILLQLWLYMTTRGIRTHVLRSPSYIELYKI